MRTIRVLGLLMLSLSVVGCKKQAEPAPDVTKPPEPTIQACIPVCEGRACGSDGCRGTCGQCDEGYSCTDGICLPPPCEPACGDRACGDDGCGGSCGTCAAPRICDAAGQCVKPPCQPDCAARECGSDGCGGSCGVCEPGYDCRNHRCADVPCVPDCSDRVCGDDGCGGSCGRCPEPNECTHGRCERRIAAGFFLGDGREPWKREPEGLGAFVRRLGFQPAVVHTYIGFPADWEGECAFGAFPREWADQVLAVNPTASLMVTLLPQCGFPAFAEGFAPDSPAGKATQKFAEAVAKVPTRVFVRFAHDMNTPWYPWGTCYFDNKKPACAEPEEYQAAFANVARVFHATARNARMVWSPHEWEPYWAEHHADYPQYAAFYPGDEAADWVALDLFYQEDRPPRPGHLAARIRGFYDEFAGPDGHGKPMAIAETAVECRVKADLACRNSLGDFNRTDGWWGAWGNLDLSRAKGAAPTRCRRLAPGYAHIVLAAKPDPEAPKENPHAAPNFYVGGTAFALDWEKGTNFERGDVLVFSGKRDKDGAVPVLQLELCDVEAPECPEDDPCCEAGTYTASVPVPSTDWELYVVPLASFKPTAEDSKATLNWRRIRAVKLHLHASQATGNLAPLHVDSLGLGNWNRKGGELCERLNAGWAKQVFSPQQCYDWPNLKMILWYHDRKTESGDRIKDYRMQDLDLFGKLLSDPCFRGRFW